MSKGGYRQTDRHAHSQRLRLVSTRWVPGCARTSFSSSIQRLRSCSSVLCTTTQRLTPPHIQVRDREMQPVLVVRNIGAQLDEILSMRSHVNSLCSRAHFYLRNVSKIRHLLDKRTTATVVHAYVTSQLDDGNALALCTPSNSAI